MDTWIEVAGLTIHSPVTVFTNLVLCVQCTVYYRAVRTGHEDRAGYWSLFFLAMAVATLAGVSKHGLSHVLSADVYLAVLWASSLGTAASVYFAQRATIISRVGPRWASRLVGLAALQLAIFLGANLILGPEMLLIVAHTAVGLIHLDGLRRQIVVCDGAVRVDDMRLTAGWSVTWNGRTFEKPATDVSRHAWRLPPPQTLAMRKSLVDRINQRRDAGLDLHRLTPIEEAVAGYERQSELLLASAISPNTLLKVGFASSYLRLLEDVLMDTTEGEVVALRAELLRIANENVESYHAKLQADPELVIDAAKALEHLP